MKLMLDIGVSPMQPNGMTVAITTETEARKLFDRMQTAYTDFVAAAIEAYTTRAWEALGYASWDEACRVELGAGRVKIPRAERPEVVSAMRGAGMSTRAIAAATGVSRETVRNESSGDKILSPATVTGIDGKTYQATAEVVRDDPPEPEPEILDAEVVEAESEEDRYRRHYLKASTEAFVIEKSLNAIRETLGEDLGSDFADDINALLNGVTHQVYLIKEGYDLV